MCASLSGAGRILAICRATPQPARHGVTCPDSPLDIEFNIDEDLIDTLIELAVKELVIMFSQMKEDVTNDSRDSSQQESK